MPLEIKTVFHNSLCIFILHQKIRIPKTFLEKQQAMLIKCFIQIKIIQKKMIFVKKKLIGKKKKNKIIFCTNTT